MQKLAAIRKEIGYIEKRGTNTFQKYSYVQAADIAAVLGEKLSERNIIVARRNLKVTHKLPGEDEKQTLVLMECEYGFVDGDDNFVGTEQGAEIWQPAWGEGRDSGDKAGYKAFTGMFKYFLIQAFMLATGDDPEDDTDEKRTAPKTKLDVKVDPPKSEPKVAATATEINEILDLCERTSSDVQRLLEFYGHKYDPAKELMDNFLGHFTKNNYTHAMGVLRGKLGQNS